MPRFSDAQRLSAGHDVERFNCEKPPLDEWLHRHARVAGGVGSAQVFVITDEDQSRRVVGYHALAAGSVVHNEATARSAKGMPRHAIPVIVLARLAVDSSVQGRGLGAWLLRDVMQRTLSVAEEIGVRALLVHAIDQSAREFYERFGFESSPTDPLNLQMIVKDIEATLKSRG